MTDLPPIEPLRFGEHNAENWKRCKQWKELFLLATEPKKPRSQQSKAAIFPRIGGQAVIEVLSALGLPAGEDENYDDFYADSIHTASQDKMRRSSATCSGPGDKKKKRLSASLPQYSVEGDDL